MQLTTTGNLTTWAADIDAAHAEAMRHAGSAIEHAKQAGALLMKVKQKLPHGEFGNWLEANSVVTVRQAQRYMAAAQGKPMPVRAIASNTTPVSYLPAPARSAEHEAELLSAANQTLAALCAENAALEAQQLISYAMRHLDGEDRIQAIEDVLSKPRLEAELKKLTVERNAVMNENAEIKRALKAQRREIDKLRATGHQLKESNV